MAELTQNFYPRQGLILHRIDVRFKLVFLVMLSTVTVHVNFKGLFLFLGTQIIIFILTRISLKHLVVNLKYFFIFLFFVFLAQALSTYGEKLFQTYFWFVEVSVTRQGLLSGARICLRLLLIVLLGYLFIWSTVPSQIRMAVSWFLKPIPLIPEQKVATMLSLLIRFLPMIVQETKETIDAQRARCIENRKNPLYRSVKLVSPLLRRIFLKADGLIMAMEARGYSENRTLPCFNSKKSDWISLFLIVILSFIMIRI